MEPQKGSPGVQRMAPSVEKSWEVIMKKVDEIDKDMTEGWKEDIDTLLVFAGLFSAVVTAFTIESLKKLSEDSGDNTVALLQQISMQLSNQNTTAANLPDFTAETSYVRVNTLWILSLILALLDALFCLLCKQWLREFQRPTKTKTAEELLALRCLRAESFEIWHIPKFLAALPIMLELALFLFFAGLLEFLWMQHYIPFSLAIVTVGGAALVYIGTTILPAADLVRQLFSIHPEVLNGHRRSDYPGHEHILMIPPMHHLCAFKSPQALVIVQLVSSFFRIPCIQGLLASKLERYFPRRRLDVRTLEKRVDYRDSLIQNLISISNWSLADLNIVQRFSRIYTCPDMYALKAFRWMVEEFEDTPAMIPHLQNVLKGQPTHAVMAAVFDQGMFSQWDDWEVQDVEMAMATRLPRYAAGWKPPASFQFSVAENQILYYHSLWRASTWTAEMTDPPFEWKSPHFLTLSPMQLGAPLTRIAAILERDSSYKAYDVGLKFLAHYSKYASPGPIRSRALEPITQFVESSCSARRHLRSNETQLFHGITFVSQQLAKGNTGALIPDFAKVYRWLDALDNLRERYNLEQNHFLNIPGFFPISLDRLNKKMVGNPQEEWVKEFKEACSTFGTVIAQDWLHHISHFVYMKASPIALSGGPPQLRNVDWVSASASQTSLEWDRISEVRKTSFPLLTSETGLSFFLYVNEFLASNAFSVPQYLPHAWNHSLDCVCKLNDKPPEYFRRHHMPSFYSSPENFDPDFWVSYGGPYLPNIRQQTHQSTIDHPPENAVNAVGRTANIQ